MILLSDDDLDKSRLVPESLVRCLDMWDVRASPRSLVRYLGEQVRLPWPSYAEVNPDAARFLVALVFHLAPPDDGDKRISFRERPVVAADKAVPWNYGDCVNLAIAMGWGNAQLDPEPQTLRGFAEEARAECLERARRLATDILEVWERAGHVYRL